MNESSPSSAPHPDRPLAAVTGATGFIGEHLVAALLEAGWRVRILTRRLPKGALLASRLEVVAGALGDEAALGRLVAGADAVFHLAGAIKAARRARFYAINRDGAAAVARATKQRAPHAHFVLVSSLAAREPALSDYAASKRAGEDAVLKVLVDKATVLRPPAVYGPGDRETLAFFRFARSRLVPLVGAADARAALIHVGDLARLVVALAASAPRGAVLAAADARPEGYRWAEVLGAAARAVGNARARLVPAPRPLLFGIAAFGDLARAFGVASLLGTQKLRELRHPDWSVSPDELARPAGWAPRFDLDRGFADAVAWYRAVGWLAR